MRRPRGGEQEDDERRQVRPAEEARVREMQFDTARRIIFGTDPVPGTEPPREFWTTAGFVRRSSIAYNTPFPLGPFTFMITEGGPADLILNNDPEYWELSFGVVVWIEMLGTMYDWRQYGHPVRPLKPTSSRLGRRSRKTPVEGVFVNERWCAIGILRSDVFLPITPNFLATVRIMTSFVPETGRRSYKRLEFDHCRLGNVTCSVQDRYSGQYVEVDSEDSGDFESSDGKEYKFYLYDDIKMQWVQGNTPNVPKKLQAIVNIDSDDWDYLKGCSENLNDKVGDTLFLNMNANGGWLDMQYSGPVPLEKCTPWITKRDAFCVPQEFMDQMSLGDVEFEFDRPCFYRYVGAQRGYGGREIIPKNETGAWMAGDMAAVCYAQSWFLHVLKGPDPRRYGVPRHGDDSPMRETTLPEPLMGLRYDIGTQCYELVAFGNMHPGGNVPLVSLNHQYRFFTERLTTRAARKLLRADLAHLDGWLSILPQFLAAANPETFQQAVVALTIIKDFRQREFLGSKCHVCLDKEPTLRIKRSGGLMICSKACMNKLTKK